MPQLVKGGKWVYGWVVVGPEWELTVPPEAWAAYGFQVGDEAACFSTLPVKFLHAGQGIYHKGAKAQSSFFDL
ncbi:MAG: hypothetical protein ACOYZ7_06145 [Chloroflexota bacterium]